MSKLVVQNPPQHETNLVFSDFRISLLLNSCLPPFLLITRRWKGTHQQLLDPLALLMWKVGRWESNGSKSNMLAVLWAHRYRGHVQPGDRCISHDTKSPCTPSRGTKTFDKRVNAFGLGWVVDCWTPLTAENIVARHQYGH